MRMKLVIWMLLLLLLGLPAVVDAQFTFTMNNGSITITGYTGTNSSVVIPAATNGYPITSIASGVFGGCTNLTSIAIPNSIISFGDSVFFGCTSLTTVTIPNSVISIGWQTFGECDHLTNVTIGDSLGSISFVTFLNCFSLTSVTIGDGVTNIHPAAFLGCGGNLTNVFFTGNAPASGTAIFNGDTNVTIFALVGTAGWGSNFYGVPIVMVPAILWPPQSQTAEVGSTVDFSPGVAGIPVVTCLWFFDGTNLISCGTDGCLEFTNVDASRDGAYTLVVTNDYIAVTSAPAMLNVVPVVPRRPVPAIQVTGEAGSQLNVDYINSLQPALNWTTLGPVSLTSTSEFLFDISEPLPPQRFYRAWQSNTPRVLPSLRLPGLVPAITLTGNIGDSLRLDYINQIGPTNAWVGLDTITLTNTSQPYFDVSALDQPARLYRIVPFP